jgi:hypothetical protein
MGEEFMARHGLVALDNSRVAEPNDGRRFSLEKPCYGFLRDFGSLWYGAGERRIVAAPEAEGTLLIDYIPVHSGPQISATAGHLEAELAEAEGQYDLAELCASEGVTYEEIAREGGPADERLIEFAGSRFVYDANTTVMEAFGGEGRQCIVNGMAVEKVRYNMQSGELVLEKLKGGAVSAGGGD